MTSWKDDSSTFKQLGIEISNPLENEAVIAVMDSEYKKSMGELSNLTRTTMKQSQIDLMNMMDEAEIRVASGVQSYSAAVCDILDKYAGRGMIIEYPTGARRTLEAAVRMCVVTSMNQTAAQVTNQYILEAESAYVLVSAHLGARTQQKGQPPLADHSAWQGRVFKIRGSEPGYPNLLESTGYDIDPETGQGKVVNPLGLHGYNCRHGHKPWDKRLRNPYLDENGNLKIDSEENRKRYELQQKQRAMERAIRKTKSELIMKQQEIDGVAETDVKEILQSQYDKLAYKLREQNQKYSEFCEGNNLQKQYDRIKVSGFKKEQSSKANGAATRYENILSNQDKTKLQNDHMDSSVREYRFLTEDGTLAEGEDVVNVLEVMTELPKKSKNALSNAVFRTNSSKGNGYNPQTGEIFLVKGASRRQVLHEIGHHLENNIMNERKLNELKRKSVQNLTKDDIMCSVIDGQKIFTLKNGNFINRYQSRLYVETLEDALNQDGTIRIEGLGEFALCW